MGTHKTWRLTFAASQGGIYLQLTEVAFLDQAGADLSVGGTAAANSSYGAGYGAASAFDKNLATDWANAASQFPASIWYTHTAPVDVRQIRIRCSASTAWLPRNLADVKLDASDDGGATWMSSLSFALSIVSGDWINNTYIVLGVAARDVSSLLVPLPTPGYVQGRAQERFAGAQLLSTPSSARQDYRQLRSTTGVISSRVMFKATPSSPESPFAMGRIWLLRQADGYKAWEGWSDAAGYYTATGLELGVEYIAVGIDPLRNHKATGAGAVVAVEVP